MFTAIITLINKMGNMRPSVHPFRPLYPPIESKGDPKRAPAVTLLRAIRALELLGAPLAQLVYAKFTKNVPARKHRGLRGH